MITTAQTPHKYTFSDDEEDIVNVSPFHGLQMPLENFLDWEPEADGWKYEWENGTIIGEEESMRTKQIGIQQRILRAFAQTQAYAQGGELLPEVDCELSEGILRRPDIAYFTAEQIAAADAGEYPIPAFVIEIVSPSDKILPMMKKLADYHTAGIQTIWYIYPSAGIVEVHTDRTKPLRCFDDDVCSAAPAITGFQMTARQVFAK
ncbi:MAG: Uma2 family endonuclease [Candidatus Kapaibacterium sp.]|nr:MAG: Uma2 family endonuclease [Candidatus Kapabacteria bacterium]